MQGALLISAMARSTPPGNKDRFIEETSMHASVGSMGRLAFLALALVFPGTATAAPGDILSTDKTNVNVRSEPSTEADIVTRMNPGDTAIEVDSKGDWFLLRLPDQDREGWVFGPLLSVVTDLEPKEGTAPPPPASTAPDNRSGASSERLLSRLSAFDENLIGDPKRGEQVFYKCGSCHTTVAGIHAQGPSLVGVFGRAPAQAPNFRYSGALQAFARDGAVWDEATLDRFIQRPARLVKGTSMPFSGIRDAQDRVDLIAYLAELDG
jgi:cytochrome c